MVSSVFFCGLFELKPAKGEVGGGMGFPSDNKLYDITSKVPSEFCVQRSLGRKGDVREIDFLGRTYARDFMALRRADGIRRSWSLPVPVGRSIGCGQLSHAKKYKELLH